MMFPSGSILKVLPLGSILAASLLSGCDALKGVGDNFAPPAVLEVRTFNGAQAVEVKISEVRGGRVLYRGTSEKGSFSLKLREGFYTVTAQVLAHGIPYEAFEGEVKLAPGATSTVVPKRVEVVVEVEALGLDGDEPALLEAYYPSQEAFGVPVYEGKTLDERVLVARGSIEKGKSSGLIQVPTGRNPLFRVVQGKREGKTNLSWVEESTKVYVELPPAPPADPTPPTGPTEPTEPVP